MASNRYDSYVKAGTERKRKSRSEKERMLLEKGGVELLQECKREESKQRQLRRKKRKKEDDAWKRMETAGNAAFATTEVDILLAQEERMVD